MTVSRLRTCLRLLLLLAALVNYAAAASAHDHDTTALSGDGLCAICVYAGGSLGGAPAPNAVPVTPAWHAQPETATGRAFFPPFRSSCSIRGPPLPT